MDVTDLSGRVGAVTGAASGIGRATAIALAERGADVAICDIDEAGLKETAERIEGLGRRAVQMRVDVASAEQMAEFADRTFQELGRCDVLVNNAGIGTSGDFLSVPLEEWDTILGINLKGVVHGCYFFLPRMIEAKHRAHVVNIASMAGFVAAPGMTAYNATKFGVLGLSEALREEMAEHDIGVTVICPGVINTPIVRNARMYGEQATDENRERGAQMFARRNYGPEKVAQGILKAIQNNRGVAPVSPEAWAGYWLKRLAPWAVSGVSRLGIRAREREQAQQSKS